MQKQFSTARMFLHIAFITLPSVVGVALGVVFLRDQVELKYGLAVPQFIFVAILLGSEFAVIKLLSGNVLRQVYGSTEA